MQIDYEYEYGEYAGGIPYDFFARSACGIYFGSF